MRQVNMHEAKTHLSRLVEEAAAGEPFGICKAGRPMVRVTRLDDGEAAAEPICWCGRWVPPSAWPPGWPRCWRTPPIPRSSVSPAFGSW